MRIKLWTRRVCDNCGKVNPPTVNEPNCHGKCNVTACCLQETGLYGPFDPDTLKLLPDDHDPITLEPLDDTKPGKTGVYSNGKASRKSLYFTIRFEWLYG